MVVGTSMNIESLIWNEAVRRGLRVKTIKTYVYCVNKFFRVYKKLPNEIRKKDIENYVMLLISWNKSSSTVHVNLMALKFFYEKVLNKKLMINVPNIRIRRKLPEFLTQDEVKRLFAVIKNNKHKLIIMLTYGSGFRVSEVIKLKVSDLDFKAGYGWIRDGKGGKDRMFIIPDKLKKELQNWITDNDLVNYVFKGYKSSHFSDSSVRNIIKNACKKAGISKKISPHSLRHSFATHILENGYSLIEVKELLGHSRIETTMIYTHLAKPKLTIVRSPYDMLREGCSEVMMLKC